MSRFRDEGALKPIGLALSAVVAGLGAAAGAAPAEIVRPHAPEPEASEADAGLALGPGAALEPFAEAPEAAPSNPFGL